jgi:hypothetical protein
VGYVRKITGAQGQIDAMNNNAAAQVSAAKTAADAQVQAMNAGAAAAADAQKQAAARGQAESLAVASASKPLATADVALDESLSGEGTGAVRKRRAQFGKNYASGVSI